MTNPNSSNNKTYPVLIIEAKPPTAKAVTLSGLESASHAEEANATSSSSATSSASAAVTNITAIVEGASSKGRTSKGRRFSAHLISYVCADQFWEGGQAKTEVIRPVWLRLAGSEQELRSFVANLQAGYKAAVIPANSYSNNAPVRYELLKSAGYRYVWQKSQLNGQTCAVVTAFIPALFQFDPGMVDPASVEFLLLPARWWVEQELQSLLLHSQPKVEEVAEHARRLGLLSQNESGQVSPSTIEDQAHALSDHTSSSGPLYWQARQFSYSELLEIIPVGAYWASYLDKRTNKPLLDDLRFYVQIYMCALEEGIAGLTDPPPPADRYSSYRSSSQATEQNRAGWNWASGLPIGLRTFNLEAGGVLRPIACKVSQARLDRFLAEQVKLYFAVRAGQDWRQALMLNPVTLQEIDYALAAVGVVGSPTQAQAAFGLVGELRPRFELIKRPLTVLAEGQREAVRFKVQAEVAGPLAIFKVPTTTTTTQDAAREAEQNDDNSLALGSNSSSRAASNSSAKIKAVGQSNTFTLVHVATGLPLVWDLPDREAACRTLIAALQAPQVDWRFFHWKELAAQPANRDAIQQLCYSLYKEAQAQAQTQAQAEPSNQSDLTGLAQRKVS